MSFRDKNRKTGLSERVTLNLNVGSHASERKSIRSRRTATPTKNRNSPGRDLLDNEGSKENKREVNTKV